MMPEQLTKAFDGFSVTALPSEHTDMELLGLGMDHASTHGLGCQLGNCHNMPCKDDCPLCAE